MKCTLAAAALLAMAGAAMLSNTGVLDSRCVVLPGDAWKQAGPENGARIGPGGEIIRTSCATPGAVPATDVVAAGEFGGQGYGPVLSMAEVRDLWVKHGGSPADAATAAAVATAESGRRPAATNASNVDGSVDRGLFQINSIHGANSTYDLDGNVAYAVQLQHAQGWSPWVAYQKGAYRRYLEAS